MNAMTLERLAELIEARFQQMDARFEQVHGRFEQIDGRFDRLCASICWNGFTASIRVSTA
jgi:hypothetical protein